MSRMLEPGMQFHDGWRAAAAAPCRVRPEDLWIALSGRNITCGPDTEGDALGYDGDSLSGWDANGLGGNQTVSLQRCAQLAHMSCRSTNQSSLAHRRLPHWQSFPAHLGTKKTFVLSTKSNTELDLANIQCPAGLKVELVETAKRKWSLNVEVPPNRFFGPVTEDNVVILHTKAGRSIRIPFMGLAVQG